MPIDPKPQPKRGDGHTESTGALHPAEIVDLVIQRRLRIVTTVAGALPSRDRPSKLKERAA